MRHVNRNSLHNDLHIVITWNFRHLGSVTSLFTHAVEKLATMSTLPHYIRSHVIQLTQLKLLCRHPKRTLKNVQWIALVLHQNFLQHYCRRKHQILLFRRMKLTPANTRRSQTRVEPPILDSIDTFDFFTIHSEYQHMLQSTFIDIHSKQSKLVELTTNQ
jgi:hypothetical protein